MSLDKGVESVRRRDKGEEGKKRGEKDGKKNEK